MDKEKIASYIANKATDLLRPKDPRTFCPEYEKRKAAAYAGALAALNLEGYVLVPEESLKALVDAYHDVCGEKYGEAYKQAAAKLKAIQEGSE